MAFKMKIRFADVVCDNSLRNTYVNGAANGYEFLVRLGYYRGLYLSCMEEFAISVDGNAVDEKDIRFCLNGKEFCPCEIKLMASEFWQVTQPAAIKVRKPGGLPAGSYHIDVTMIFRSPYLPMPGSDEPHTYVPIDSCGENTLTITGKEAL